MSLRAHGLGSGLYLHRRRWSTYSLYGSRSMTHAPVSSVLPTPRPDRCPRCEGSTDTVLCTPPVRFPDEGSWRRVRDYVWPKPCAIPSATTQRPLLYPVELRAQWRSHLTQVVGVERFELPTSCSQSRRATRLRYTPTRHPATNHAQRGMTTLRFPVPSGQGCATIRILHPRVNPAERQSAIPAKDISPWIRRDFWMPTHTSGSRRTKLPRRRLPGSAAGHVGSAEPAGHGDRTRRALKGI